MTPSGQPTPRQRYEAKVKSLRSRWAIAESQSDGRKVAEPSHPYRTCFQRDRDRIIHCSAFRRLDYKTQVFVPHQDDHFRTRLTHTLEVAQVARDIARALGANEDLAEATALAHDLGHSPFGHNGEAVLDDLMRDHGGFEHNRQSLRIVDYLEHPYPNFRGLNLTQVVRECLARHETRYDTPSSEEFGAGRYGPLEGQIVDLADEIAYTSADLEDALSAGLANTEQLAPLELWRRAKKRADGEYADAGAIHQRIRATKAVLAEMADDLIACTVANLEALGATDADHIRDADARTAAWPDHTRQAVDELQQFLLDNVYCSDRNAKRRSDTERVLRRLFAAYVENISLLPERYQRRIDTEGLHRVVCDFLAGMTDRYCLQTYEQICGE